MSQSSLFNGRLASLGAALAVLVSAGAAEAKPARTILYDGNVFTSDPAAP
jgi:hypothetical protein